MKGWKAWPAWCMGTVQSAPCEAHLCSWKDAYAPPPKPWTEIKGVYHIPLLNPTHSTPDTRPLTGLLASVFAPYIHKASAIILIQPKSQHITLLLKIFPCSHLNMIKTSVGRVSDKALHICPQILTNQDSADTHGTDGWKWHTHGNRWSWTCSCVKWEQDLCLIPFNKYIKGIFWKQRFIPIQIHKPIRLEQTRGWG